MKRQEANDLRVQTFGHAEQIAFVCECAAEDCRRSVLLSPDAFLASREQGQLVVFPGHVPLADEPMTAEREARLETRSPGIAAG